MSSHIVPQSYLARTTAMSFSLYAASFAAIICLLLYLRSLFPRGRYRLPLPPGPKPKPIIGNLIDLPKTSLWHTVSQWKKIYGESYLSSLPMQHPTESSGGIIHVKVFGETFIFLNDYDIAVDLLDKRSAIYSSKPRLVMLREMYEICIRSYQF